MKEESVTHVVGLFCYLCRRSDTTLSRDAGEGLLPLPSGLTSFAEL